MNTHLKQLWAAMKLPEKLQKSYKFFCRGLDIRVANVMPPDAFYPRCLAAILHFVIQKALGVGKEPVVLLQPAAMGHILLQTGAKTVGNEVGSAALGHFRCGDNVLSAETMIALVYRQGFLFKVDVRRRKRQ